MKKLLTILILLLAVVTQGWAVDAITTLYPLPHDVGSWNSLQIDYDLVSGIQSGDKITIYINKDDRNHNIQVQYEKPKESGDGNDWTGIGIDLATETEGEIYSITMTETAAGYFNETTKSKLILTGENYTVTKVTLTHDDTPKQLFPKTVINGWGNISISKDLFTNAVVNDIVKAEFNESVSSAELKFLYGWGSGEEYTITTDETSKIVSLTIASEEILNNKLKEKGLLISPRSGNSVSIKDVKIVPTYQLSVTTENGKLYLGDTETEYTNNTRYESGSTVTLRAVANEGYRFVNWKNGNDVVSEIASYTTPALSADLTLTANFIQQFTVTAASDDTNQGTVAITNADANNKYDAGTNVVVTATPKTGYTFDCWIKEGDDSFNETSSSYTISNISANWGLTAKFKSVTKDTPDISLSNFSNDDNPSDGVTFNNSTGVLSTTEENKSAQQWIGDNSGVTGNKLVVKLAGTPTGENQSVKVAVVYVATEYSEVSAYTDENNIAVVNLDNSKYIKNIYIQLSKAGSVTINSVALDPLYTITATSADANMGTATVETAPTSDSKYAYGTSVTVTATPESSYSFFQWKVGDNSVSTDASYTFTATEDVALTAEFTVAKTTQTLKTATQKMVNETVGTKVLIANSAFENVSPGDILTVNMSEVATSGAFIVLKENANGHSFFGDDYCSPLTSGWTSFTHTLTASDIALLDGDNNALCITGEGFTCGNITITSAGSITADAAHTTMYVLSVTQPEAGGTIQIGGTDAAAQKAYDNGSQVTLTAVRNGGYALSKWTKDDADAGSESTLSVTFDGADIAVTATFVETAPITYPITVWEKTDENGIAISWDSNSWTGIQVQTSNSEYSSWQSKLSNVVENDVIKLYVNPVAEGDKSYDVRYWANSTWTSLPSLSPNNNIISIPLTSDLANAVKTSGLFITGIRYYLTKVTVEKPKYQLTIVSDGGNVTVKKGEETTADREFEAGTELTLTATPASGIYTFSKWQKNGTDIDGGTNPTLSTTMDEADMTITAVFTTSVDPQDLGAASTEIKAKTDTQNEQGIVIPCWRFKNASVGDIITINMTETEPGTITLKQSDNGWGDLDNSAATDKALAVGTTSFTYALTETSLPLVKANGLYVMGDKFTCTSVTLISAGTVPTSDTRTEKYIYNESKTITTEATATIAKEIFTNASIGDKLTLTVSSVDNATITLKSGEETIKSESGVSATSYSYTLQSSDITKVKANGLTIAGSGFTLDKVHLLTEGEVTEVSDPVPDFSLDNFKADEGNTYDKTNHILTNTNNWSGMTLSIGDGSTYSGSSLEVRTKEVSKLKILVK